MACGLIILTFGWAVAILITRSVKSKNAVENNLNFGVILTLTAGVIFFLYPENKYSEDPWMMLKCMVYQGVPLAVSQHFFMLALVLSDKSGIITMVGFVGMVFSYFLSVIRYDESLNWICVVGALLVTLGVYRIVIT